jgi:hypothetical protein
MSGRETDYMGQYKPLHVPMLHADRRQLARNRLNCLDNVGEGRDLSLAQRLVGCVCSHQRTILMRFPC